MDFIGKEQLVGKEKVIDACQKSADYLTSLTTKFSKFTVSADDDRVVIDSTADYADEEQNRACVASSDICRFTNGILAEITSYTTDVSETQHP